MINSGSLLPKLLWRDRGLAAGVAINVGRNCRPVFRSCFGATGIGRRCRHRRQGEEAPPGCPARLWRSDIDARRLAVGAAIDARARKLRPVARRGFGVAILMLGNWPLVPPSTPVCFAVRLEIRAVVGNLLDDKRVSSQNPYNDLLRPPILTLAKGLP